MAREKSYAEQRVSFRKIIPQPVSIELIGLGPGRAKEFRIDGQCVDISSEGMGMTTVGALHQGDVLKLHFAVVDMQVTLPILTEVMWSRPVEDHYRAGLRFLA